MAGFEYYGNPNNRANGYIHWMSEGVRSWTMRASAVRANPLSQVSQRLISEEPMAIVSAALLLSSLQLTSLLYVGVCSEKEDFCAFRTR